MINITFPDGAVRQYAKAQLLWTLQNQYQKDWQEKLLLLVSMGRYGMHQDQ